jgi:putative transposase
VWVTKYRKPVLCKEIAERVRDLIREICKANNVEIIRRNVSKDHVHIFVSIPAPISVSQMIQWLKEKTSRKMLMEYKSLSRAFWRRHLWAMGDFAGSSGNVTDEVIMKYIE